LLAGGEKGVNFKIVTKDKNEDLRKEFIERFVDIKTQHYKNYIETLKEYPDGMCYDGYLWDSLKADYKQTERTMEQAVEYLKNKDNVFVMWDIYSKHRVYDNRILPNKYPKDTVIEINTIELCPILEKEWGDNFFTENKYLPEDIYVFDRGMKWYVIFTHEGYDSLTKSGLEEDAYIRICFIYESTK
jgi:hypothetical protein